MLRLIIIKSIKIIKHAAHTVQLLRCDAHYPAQNMLLSFYIDIKHAVLFLVNMLRLVIIIEHAQAYYYFC
jgi:hypothetical protein